MYKRLTIAEFRANIRKALLELPIEIVDGKQKKVVAFVLPPQKITDVVFDERRVVDGFAVNTCEHKVLKTTCKKCMFK